MDTRTLFGTGLVLLFVGALIIIVAILLLFVSNIRGKGEARGGGAIMIGPVPIIFGADKESFRKILLLSITLTVLLVILTVVMYLLSKRVGTSC